MNPRCSAVAGTSFRCRDECTTRWHGTTQRCISCGGHHAVACAPSPGVSSPGFITNALCESGRLACGAGIDHCGFQAKRHSHDAKGIPGDACFQTWALPCRPADRHPGKHSAPGGDRPANDTPDIRAIRSGSLQKTRLSRMRCACPDYGLQTCRVDAEAQTTRCRKRRCPRFRRR